MNLTDYEEYVDLTCRYYAGSFRRASFDLASDGVDMSDDYSDSDSTARELLSLQHHLLFERLYIGTGKTWLFLLLVLADEGGLDYHSIYFDSHGARASE